MKEKFAHILDLIIKPKGNISVDGFISGKCSDKILKKISFDASLPNDGTKQFIIENKVGKIIIKDFFNYDKIIYQDIIDYKCDPEFDICYYFGTQNKNDKPHRNSQLWHHDSVGHRLKLFIALNSGWTTFFLKKSHFNKNLFNSSLSKEERIKLSETMNHDKNAIRIDLKKCDWVIFDTNAFHKGHVEPNYSGEIIAFEFSNKYKKSWMGKVGNREVL